MQAHEVGIGSIRRNPKKARSKEREDDRRQSSEPRSSHSKQEERDGVSSLSIVREDIAYLLGPSGAIKRKIMKASGANIELLDRELKVRGIGGKPLLILVESFWFDFLAHLNNYPNI